MADIKLVMAPDIETGSDSPLARTSMSDSPSSGTPLVSLIIPVYNGELYLASCLTGVLAQSYPNIEVIVIDDGSTDTTRQIAETFAGQDHRVVYHRQSNGGPAAARNTGLDLMHGEYLLFVDADDQLEPDAIATLVKAMVQADLIIAAYHKSSTGNRLDPKAQLVSYGSSALLTQELIIGNLGQMIEDGLFHYLWHKLYVVRIIGSSIRFCETVRIGEDLLFNLDYLERAKRVRIIDVPVYTYRTGSGDSITQKYHPDLFSLRRTLHEALCTFLKRHDAFRGANRILVERLYARRITDCLGHIVAAGQQVSVQTKRQAIKTIVHDQTVRAIIGVFRQGGQTQKVVGILIQIQAVTLIYLFYRTRQMIKAARSGKARASNRVRT